MAAYAIFRLPYSDSFTMMAQDNGEPERLASYAALNGRSGFVMAPFAITDDSPLLLIRPDRIGERPVSSNTADDDGMAAEISSFTDSTLSFPLTAPCGESLHTCRETYAADFADCHARLRSGEYRKIVLARSADVETETELTPAELFVRACRMYPRMFVVLVSTPQSGTWLAATPEILLEGGHGQWQTIALAGTMKLDDSQMGFDCPPTMGEGADEAGIMWSEKNIQEQRCVATYIADCLKPFATDGHEEGPRTARAGGVVHLRSDFTFCLNDASRLGNLLAALHPTPAVCGLPKAETWRHIIQCEHTERRYYSGFMGPLAPDADTHLYVSLRCMQFIGNRRYRLYAGGGLLKDSKEETEWHETEAKMETMERILKDIGFTQERPLP